MKAIVQNVYGPPEALKLTEVNKPVVKENGILVRVLAASLNAGDLFSLRGSPWLVRLSNGFPNPKDYVLGWDVAGVVESVGENALRFQPGDQVYGSCSRAFAEYVSASENRFALKPANLSFEQAACLPTAAITALQGLRDAGKLQPGQKILINGASGGVGIFAVQIAKALGAEVTGVCSTRNVEVVCSLGADHVIDYTREDFTRGAQRYDLILDNVASHPPSALRRVLSPRGVIIPNSGHGGMSYVIKSMLLSQLNRQHGKMFLANPNTQDLDYVKELAEAGKLIPLIDKSYPLADTPQALRYLDESHARGKVVITMGDS